MTEPHPLRCETCKFHRENKYMDFCGDYAMSSDDPTEIVNFIRQKGCASHSAATSAGAVLEIGVDYIIQKLQQEYDDGGYDPDIPLWSQVLSDLKKLRQERGR